MRLIDVEKLAEYKASGVSKLTEWQRGWNDAFDTIMGETPTVDAESLITMHEDIGYEKGYRDGYAEALEVIDNAEPVRHGHWIWHGSYYTCSVCGEEQYGVDTGRYYCQNCGAKMDEVEDG